MQYKNKSDIPYFKFLDFARSIKDQPEEFTLNEINRIFSPDNLEAFNKALETDAPPRSKLRFNLDFKTAGVFVDADTYYSDGSFRDFFKLVLRKRRFSFKSINFDKITLADAEHIVSKFVEIKEKLKADYDYLYNPPIRFNASNMTQGGIEREAFSEHYGPYIEMFYILCQGDFTKFDEISDWDLHRFLFQAEYLIRKRDVENIK